DKEVFGFTLIPSTGWGVDDLDAKGRIVKALDAGIDQFGGEQIPELLVELVEEGKVAESRLDESVKRILRDKFTLGLFDEPYLDLAESLKTMGKAEFVKAGKESQRKAMVLLKNEGVEGKKALPLTKGLKIYVENIAEGSLAGYGTVVETPEEADIAILRLQTPWEPINKAGSMLENFFHQGDLDFKGEEKERILKIMEGVPTIVDMYMDRPAVIPEIAAKAVGLTVNFGAEDDALLDVLFGNFTPSAKLPFELPSSMEAVRKQKEDVPYDSKDPLYPFGAGLSYD
ncbi:MAG: glycoside hydrolase family 3 C-terminal domain-containing protein, partial [Bacteroidota bacterium]